MKQVAAMALSKKHNQRLIFENRTGTTVNNILPDDEANEAFNKIDGNIAEVHWEAEIQDQAAYFPELSSNQYAVLEDKEGDKEKYTKSIGVEKNGEITGLRHNNKITGVDSDNDSMESGSAGATEKVYEMALIEEAISEAEQDIAEWTDLIAGNKIETEDTRNENVIHPDLQVPTVEYTYNLRQRKYPRPEYTNRYGF